MADISQAHLPPARHTAWILRTAEKRLNEQFQREQKEKANHRSRAFYDGAARYLGEERAIHESQLGFSPADI